jgi:uncharacterized protein YbjQ (UPF0145 family)
MQGYLLIFGDLRDFIAFYVKLSGIWFAQFLQSEFARWLTNSWLGTVFGRLILFAAIGSLLAALFYRKQRMKRRISAERQAVLSRQNRWSMRLTAHRSLESSNVDDSTELTVMQAVPTSSTGSLLGWSIRRQICYVRVDSCETMDAAELKIKSKAIGLGANALINLKFSVVNGKYAAEADAVVATSLDESVVDREIPTTATYAGSKAVRPTHP